ncbi:acetyltransferase [Apiospora rasikravindrae]|uniref:Acetyltransferase n=1 Tax=Apiospora rasikravindrae TaxID=990691 RepID=A0ABR1UBK2_9PEZI
MATLQTKTPDGAFPAPIVTTSKCYLRPYDPRDAPAASSLANDAEVVRFLRDRFPHPYTLEDSHTFIKSTLEAKPVLDFAVFATPNGDCEGEFAGGMGLTPGRDVQSRTWELGYWIGQKFWGQGIATMAVKAFARWAFQTFPELHRLEAEAYHMNAGSIRVLEKAGFTKDGVRRSAACKKGVVMDVHVYGLLRDELDGLE